ncbi:MAG TPA: hypothetical protein VEV37_00680 [Bryobacteraceae bacterium]|nr:hypothetical protein [Bryobacteraceae bacterium]
MSTTTAPLTVEECLALPESSDQRRELIGGEVFNMSCGKRGTNWLNRTSTGSC